MPWMLNAKAGTWVQFEYKPVTFEDGENGKGWSCYLGEFKNILDASGDDIIGTNEVPFWAMEDFFEFWEPNAESKKWLAGRVKIKKDKDDKRTAIFDEAE